MTTIQTIGRQIAKLRKENNITQEELAKNLDVSAQAVSKWENGGAPDVEMMPRIADYFDVSIDYLFDRKMVKEEINFAQRDFIERLDSLQKQIAENSLYIYNDTIKSLVALEFTEDNEKGAAISNISTTFCVRDELLSNLMKNYQRIYEQSLSGEKQSK
jgi:transcriptional regulator with XRE-family HTH domain